VVGRLCHLDDTADLDDGLALGDQLLGGLLLRRSLRLELADDLLRRVPGAFHGRVPGPVWPDEDSHSPWTDCRGPHHSRDKAHLFDGLAAAAKELLLAGMGTAFEASGIEVDHHAADFAAGERDDGHGTGARDPTDPPDVR